MVDVLCPKCATRLTAPDAAIGQRAKCANCGHGFDIAQQSDIIEYQTTVVRKRSPFILGMTIFGIVAIVAIIFPIGIEIWRKVRPEPLHVLKARLDTISYEIWGLEIRKRTVGDPKEAAELGRPGKDDKPWSAQEERRLNDLRQEQQKIKDELTDRGH